MGDLHLRTVSRQRISLQTLAVLISRFGLDCTRCWCLIHSERDRMAARGPSASATRHRRAHRACAKHWLHVQDRSKTAGAEMYIRCPSASRGLTNMMMWRAFLLVCVSISRREAPKVALLSLRVRYTQQRAITSMRRGREPKGRVEPRYRMFGSPYSWPTIARRRVPASGRETLAEYYECDAEARRFWLSKTTVRTNVDYATEPWLQ